MKAARYYGNHDIRIEDIPEPKVTPGTVGIDVAWCGICGTDLHEYLDGPIFCPPAGHPHPISGEDSPITLGHEMSGVVYEVGEGVEGLEVGDHVVVEPYIIADGVDTGPDSNDYHLSKDMNFIGLAGRGGGLSEKIAVERRWVHKISKDIPLDQAALIEPFSVAVHAVERSGAKAGDVAIVGGAGPIGVLCGAALKAIGATVVVSELSELRRQKALDSGAADYAFDPREVDVVEKVRELTDGKGANVAIEATSVQVVLDTLMDALRPTGVLLIVSIWGHKADFDMHKLVMKEIDMRGSIAYVNTHPKTIKMVEEGKVDLKPFITGKIGLDDLIDKGFDTLINRNETAVKILVSPSGEGLE
ncbi:2,3-butanediol dehydrogenase [Pseudoglutamicibacter albus]|uniref:2,3-butanediol dehydrogenase n=1 Tax=Pseudoglutamicibacter cumminsii TaxID=156979 RepID=A0AAP4CB77_9MICC|nr:MULTISPECIES: 2,3-butanediol dehydrogenase [Pseudoglutamicibacter]MCT1686107.1 2,3-butanediol dehydrogenase [Pseudoglutamicibacter cumminsii]MDK6275091.1 2,3-butanediol dehydrogenase [Pseudoglutamicibacter cumminsii]PKY80740.1 2,3-butanediol dehydrogenase [Pseudoglutamicibacter albus]WIK85019.1 2,3-butanediol dehydrogenase [Pseudoglutamicibacter albus]